MKFKINPKVIMIIITVLVFGGKSFGQVGLNQVAQSTMNFLVVSLSPRASAMGDAYDAVGTGAESMFYNPAGMVETTKNLDVTINYTQWIADIKYLGGAASYNLGNYGAVGVSMETVNYGTIYGTSLAPSPNNPIGYIDNGTVSNVGAYCVGLSYAKAISTQFSLGGTIKIAGQNLGTSIFYTADGSSSTTKNDATKLVFDVGVKYITDFNDFRFGMVIRNFSSDIKREEIYEQLPLTFTVGAAINLMGFIQPVHSKNNNLTFAVDFVHPNNYSERLNIGLEYTVLGMLDLRTGYETNRSIAGWSAGVGIHHSIGSTDVRVDYSYSKMQIFNDVSRLSVGFSL